MHRHKVTIVDYGMGNIGSVVNALDYIGCGSSVSSDPDAVAEADCLLLPGVGSFRKAMTALNDRGLDSALLHAVRTRGTKILGICLGMQLMGLAGSEDGETPGLGLIPAHVDRFTTEEVLGAKIPHVGFNSVRAHPESRLMHKLPTETDFYFVHAYRMLPEALPGLVTTCDYGLTFTAAYEHENVYATQFHPEKSQSNGLILLKNFVMQA
jgi:glutamine amidotransferase